MFWEVPKTNLKDRDAAIERVYAFHASRYFDQIEAFADAKIALGVLKERFELHVVTSRQADIEDQTRQWVATNFPSVFSELHFGNHFGKEGKKISKPDMCANIGAVALIDDSMDYARQCADAGLPVFLFGEYAPSPWIAPPPPRVPRTPPLRARRRPSAGPAYRKRTRLLFYACPFSCLCSQAIMPGTRRPSRCLRSSRACTPGAWSPSW